MNAKTTQRPESKFQMYNDDLRKFEDIDIEDAEILPGQYVSKVYWCNSMQRYLTVPGASLYRMNSNFELELER